ncbi:MAG TPA: Rieske 2Fe-2S domain-containing protein [Acidimicrobiales bacterium]
MDASIDVDATALSPSAVHLPTREMIFPKNLPLPYGWFRAVDSSDLVAGAVLPFEALERWFVAWREETGAAHVTSAFCPHLGTNIGFGGEVHGAELRCPFHGWCFDGSGRNSRIPYSDRTIPDARLVSYPVVETADIVMFWFHPGGIEPGWEIPILPAVPAESSTPWRKHQWEIDICWQEMNENGVDLAHFQQFHRLSELPRLESYETDGPLAKIRTVQTLARHLGYEEVRLDSDQYGPGFGVARLGGFFNADVVATTTPMTKNSSRIQIQFSMHRNEHEHVTRVAEEMFHQAMVNEFTQDAKILARKAYLPRPYLAPGDGPIMKYRRWAQQFHIDG